MDTVEGFAAADSRQFCEWELHLAPEGKLKRRRIWNKVLLLIRSTVEFILNTLLAWWSRLCDFDDHTCTVCSLPVLTLHLEDFCLSVRTLRQTCVFVCLQDILSSIDPLLPAALVKCLYLLVCLPAKTDNEETEETFQELLTKVYSPNGTIFFSYFLSVFFLPHFAIYCCRRRCLCFIQCFFFLFPGPAPALQTADQCGAAGGNSGAAVSYHRPHVTVGPDKRRVEAPGLPCPQGGLCCGNQQHRPLLARWRNILICLLSASPDTMNRLGKQGRKGYGETRRLDYIFFYQNIIVTNRYFVPLMGLFLTFDKTSQRRCIVSVFHMMTPSAQIIQFAQMFQ